MTTAISSVSSAINEHNSKLLQSLVVAKGAVCKLFFDRELRIVAYSSIDAKHYILSGEKSAWLAALTLTDNVFSSVELYENKRQVESGSAFKRSSYPPEMVFQEQFCDSTANYAKSLLEARKKCLSSSSPEE